MHARCGGGAGEMRVGKASSITRTASMTPEQRSWSSTIEEVKARACEKV